MTHRGEARAVVVLDPPADGVAGAAWGTALALATIARTPIETTFGDATGGLSADQLSFARAMSAVCGGEVVGAEGDRNFRFTPGSRRPGAYTLELPASASAAGATIMLALPLGLAGGPSTLVVRGATHARGVLSFPELAFGCVPALELAGAAVEVVLDSAGFLPDGGGAIRTRVFPAPRIGPVDFFHRGVLVEVRALACVANVGIGIAMPLERRAAERLRGKGISASVEILPMPVERGRGLSLVIAAQFERVRLCLVASGESGRSAESVADEAVDELAKLLSRRGAVNGRFGEYLVAPCALAASPWASRGSIGQGGPAASRFTVCEVTAELLAAAQVARRVLGVEVLVQGLPGEDGLVEIRPAAQS